MYKSFKNASSKNVSSKNASSKNGSFKLLREITLELHQIKFKQVLKPYQHHQLQIFLSKLEKETGLFFSLYVYRPSESYPTPHYNATIHVGGIASRGPIDVIMYKYEKYSGRYSSVGQLNTQVLLPLRTIDVQPTIHTGLITTEGVYDPNRSIELIIRSNPYEFEESEIIGVIQFSPRYLRNIKIGTVDQIPPNYLDQLKQLQEEFEIECYWVQGLGNCGDLYPFSPINPSPDWSAYQKMNLFLKTLDQSSLVLP